MRDSASPAPLVFPNSADTSRGTNQSGVKLYNKSLVLSLVRRYGSLSKTEIGRRTGLSTQTSSVIMKQLEDDGLLIRKEPMRGKVGQPSIPMSLNPEGAFSIGFKFGRRSSSIGADDVRLSGAESARTIHPIRRFRGHNGSEQTATGKNLRPRHSGTLRNVGLGGRGGGAARGPGGLARLRH